MMKQRDKTPQTERNAQFWALLEEFTRILQALRLSPPRTVNALQVSALAFLIELLRQDKATFATVKKLNLTKRKAVYPYKKATLHDCGGDLSGRWFVNYGIFDHDKGKVVRRRIYKYFGEIDTLEGRYEKAKELIDKLNKNLPFASLNNPALQDQETIEPKKFTSLSSALFEIIALEYQPKDKRKTHHAHKSHARKLVEWADRSEFNFYKVELFKREHAQAYVDYLKTTGITSQTVRNSAAGVRALFGHMVQRQIIKSNPFEGVKLPSKTRSDYHQAFNQEEQQAIKQYCLDNDPYLWDAIQVIYYTYLRPIELGRLQVEDIKLDQGQIYVPGEKSKNKKGAFLELPPPLVPVFEKMELHKYQAKDFVFTAKKTPGEKPISYNYLSSRFKKVSQALNLPNKKTLYAWKHTGVVSAYKNGVDIKAIQQQCRHSSIEQTDTYLKSLGFSRNESFALGVKPI